jgi:hypothetical protein
MRKTYLILIIFTVAAILIGLGGFLYYQNKKEKKAAEAPVSTALPTEEGTTTTTPSGATTQSSVASVPESLYEEGYPQEHSLPPVDPDSTKIPADFPDQLLYSGNYQFIEVDTSIVGEGSAIPNRVIFFSYDTPENIATYYYHLPDSGWTVEEKQEIPETKSYFYALKKNAVTAYVNIDPTEGGTRLVIRYY